MYHLDCGDIWTEADDLRCKSNCENANTVCIYDFHYNGNKCICAKSQKPQACLGIVVQSLRHLMNIPCSLRRVNYRAVECRSSDTQSSHRLQELPQSR